METVLELQTMTTEQEAEQDNGQIVAGARSQFSLTCAGSNLSLLYCY